LDGLKFGTRAHAGPAEKSGRRLALRDSKFKVKSKRTKRNHERVTLVRVLPVYDVAR